MRRRINREARRARVRAAGQRIEKRQPRAIVFAQIDAQRALGIFRRKNIDRVAAHAESPALKIELRALVLHRRQATDNRVAGDFLAALQMQHHAVVIDRIADAVNRRHRRHNQAIASLHQRLRRRQAHLLDMLVYARVLFDEQIARRHIRFGLIIIVIRDEILDGVFRKKAAKLRVKLRRQRFVVGENHRRAILARDDLRHREGFSRSGHAEQSLALHSFFDSGQQAGDGLRLIAGRSEIGGKRKLACRRRGRTARFGGLGSDFFGAFLGFCCGDHFPILNRLQSAAPPIRRFVYV